MKKVITGKKNQSFTIAKISSRKLQKIADLQKFRATLNYFLERFFSCSGSGRDVIFFKILHLIISTESNFKFATISLCNLGMLIQHVISCFVLFKKNPRAVGVAHVAYRSITK